MKFICRQQDCPGVGLRDTGCPRCQFAVTPLGVLGFVWRSLISGLSDRLGVRCPTCGGVIPAFQSTCPGCGTTLTVERIVDETLGPTRERTRQLIAPTPIKVTVFQWVYLVISAVVFWSLLSGLQSTAGTDAVLPALLSVFFLVLFLGLFVWMVPRATILAINQRAPKRIKLALLFNFLTSVILLHMAVKEWWARATLLATLFTAIGVGFWIFWKFLWPLLGSSAPTGPKPFNPQAPQGRTVETE